MRIVVAPDKFKGSLSAPEVAAHLGHGLRGPQARVGVLAAPIGPVEVAAVPVADGGEGTLDAALQAGFGAMAATVHGPLGEPVSARIAVGTPATSGLATPQDRVGVVEMAAASGLDLLPLGPDGERRFAPLTATSRGTGDLVLAALDAGCTVVLLGVGGSANTDGGAGLLAALGARLLDAAGQPVPDGGGGLGRLHRVDLSDLDPRVATTRFVLASDVVNPLLGAGGAAAVFGPQKGATPTDVATLEAGLTRLRDALATELGPRAAELADAEGAGAAGGVGYAALAVLGAERRAGIEVVLELVGLAEQLVGADLVITGEGSLDQQSLAGKAPVGVARLARAAGVPVVAVCGRTTLGADEISAAGFVGAYALIDLEPDLARCIREAGPLLEQVGARIRQDLPVLTGAPITPG